MLKHYAIVAAPFILAICSQIQDKVPPKYAIFVVAVAAAVMYFLKSPLAKEDSPNASN